MSWDSIVNQARIKELFRSILTRKRLAHAYIFSGSEGVGKDAVAIELAKVVNCEQSKIDACDTCPSCRRAAILQHPNIHLIFPLPVGKGEKNGDMPLAKLSDDEVKLVQEQIQIKSKNSYHVIAVPKANTIKINSVREIRRDVALTAFSSGKKVFILIDAEYLSDESASALLKTLEEPPEDTLIILTTAYPDQLLPTILSRCQHVRFGPLGAEDIQKALLEREAIEIGEARLIAQMADGSYGRALRLVQSDIHDRRDRVVNFLRTILRGSRMDIVNAIERLASELDKADVEEFLLLLQAWFRDAMVLQHGGGNGSAISGDDALAKFAAHYGAINVAPIITEVERAISLVNKNVYIPLVLMTLAFKLQSSMTTPSTR